MHLFVELWNVKQAWLDLTKAEQIAYAEAVGGAVGQLLEAGIEMVGWSVLENEDKATGYQYLAVWKMPSKAEVEMFNSAVEQAGWYNYFEQANAIGELQGPMEVIGHSMHAK